MARTSTYQTVHVVHVNIRLIKENLWAAYLTFVYRYYSPISGENASLLHMAGYIAFVRVTLVRTDLRIDFAFFSCSPMLFIRVDLISHSDRSIVIRFPVH